MITGVGSGIGLASARLPRRGRPVGDGRKERSQHDPDGTYRKADEVAAPMPFLASDESSYNTGISLPTERSQTAV